MDTKVILGCGGHAFNIAEIILCQEPNVRLLFFDETAKINENKLGFPVTNKLPSIKCRYIVGIGDNAKRKKKFEELNPDEVFSAISPKAYCGIMTKIGIGCFVAHMCTICAGTEIGENSILGTSCVIAHDCQVGRHCFVGPNATLAGYARLGDMVFIGAGATVIDKISICSGAIVGAGATVIDDITEPGTYVGIPARRIK